MSAEESKITNAPILPYPVLEHTNDSEMEGWQKDCVHRVPQKFLRKSFIYHLIFVGKNGLEYRVKLARSLSKGNLGFWIRQFETDYGLARIKDTDSQELYLNFARMVKTLKNYGEHIEGVMLTCSHINYSDEDVEKIISELRASGYVGEISTNDFLGISDIYRQRFNKDPFLSPLNSVTAAARVRRARMTFKKYLPSWKILNEGKDGTLEVEVPKDL